MAAGLSREMHKNKEPLRYHNHSNFTDQLEVELRLRCRNNRGPLEIPSAVCVPHHSLKCLPDFRPFLWQRNVLSVRVSQSPPKYSGAGRRRTVLSKKNMAARKPSASKNTGRSLGREEATRMSWPKKSFAGVFAVQAAFTCETSVSPWLNLVRRRTSFWGRGTGAAVAAEATRCPGNVRLRRPNTSHMFSERFAPD